MSRVLSPVERVLWQIDQVIRQNFTMIAHISGLIKENILRDALNIIQQKYPPLRWKIIEQNGGAPIFNTKNVPEIPLRILRRKDDDHWIEEAEKEIEETFPFLTGPLVRVVLLSSNEKSDLLFTFCHIASDATSGVKVIENLLKIIEKLNQGKIFGNIASLPEPPASIDAIRKNIKYPPELFNIFSRIDKFFFKPVELTQDIDISPEKRRTRIIHIKFSEHESQELISNCKSKKISMHGLICAAYFQVVVEQIKKESNFMGKNLLIGCFSPVNIRHLFSNPNDDDIGYYISIAVHFQKINEKESIWKSAKKIMKSLKKEIKYGRDVKILFELGETLKNINNLVEWVRSLHESNPPLVVTNLGKLNIPETFGSLKLEGLHFPVSIHFDSKCGLGISITTFRKRITINFLYAEPTISKKKAELLVENLILRLRDAI